MAEAQKPFLIGAAAGLVMLAVAAPVVALLWTHAAADRAKMQTALADVGAKLDKTNASLDEMRKAASLAGVTKQLDELNTRIKSTNEALAGVQKASLDNIRDRLERVEAGIKTGNAALAGLQKGLAPDGMSKQLGQLAANLTALETSLADLKQGMASKAAAPASGDELGKRLGQLAANLSSVEASLADLKQSVAAKAAPAAPAAHGDDVADVLARIKKGLDDNSASDGKVLAALGSLQQALQKGETSAQASPGAELVVVHMAAPQPPPAPGVIAPLSVHFQKIGGTDEAAQTTAIIGRLKDLLKDRHGCSVAVAGYADTLGGDGVNVAISRNRAHIIAARLKQALGDDVAVTETAWGERRLHELTRDNVPDKANRRVDIAVQCKS